MQAAHTMIFGGSFDPVHIGHLVVARAAAEAIGAGRVVLMPTAANPLKTGPQASPEDRLTMLALAVVEDEFFAVSDIELRRGQPSYTIDTVEAIQAGPDRPDRLSLLIGADSLEDLPKWHRVEDLLEAAEIHLAVRPPDGPEQLARKIEAMGEPFAGRLGGKVLETPLVDISATAIRSRLGRGQPIRYLVPEAVRRYIAERNLYR